MTITDRLIKLDPTLKVYNEGEWSKTVSEYSAFNDAGVECEVGEFLYSTVRVLKPDWVLETGTHKGIGASYMALALKDNNKGKLDTIEFLPELYKRACDRFHDLELTNEIDTHLIDVRLVNPHDKQYQLILLDTEPQTRFGELVKFFPNLAPGGFVFIHDLNRHMGQQPNEEHGFGWPFGVLPKEINEWVRNGELLPLYFPTPRGLTGFYKRHEGDYNWNKGV